VFKKIRITILLSILAVVAVSTYLQIYHVSDWKKPLFVTLYPINGDNLSSTQEYINSIAADQFHDINRFMESEAQAYGLTRRPLFLIATGKQLESQPPAPPKQQQKKLSMILWSLKLRYWLIRHAGTFGLDTRHIRIFVVYHKGEKDKALEHSYGLQKGLIGVVNAYASEKQTQQNNIVITHELLHVLGAKDKYNTNSMPVFPEGYAEPEKIPLLPQEYAEIMAGRIPETAFQSIMPSSLDLCVIGPTTASEINWSGFHK